MITANRVHQFLNSAREWDALLRGELPSEQSVSHRLATNELSAVLEIDLPGYERSDLDVEIDGQQLFISTQRKAVEGETPNYRVAERLHSPSEYQFQFPFQFDAEKTEVNYANGVLRVSIQKSESERLRKLDVK